MDSAPTSGPGWPSRTRSPRRSWIYGCVEPRPAARRWARTAVGTAWAVAAAAVLDTSLVLAAEPFAVVAQVDVHRSGVLPHLIGERSHQVPVATPLFPHIQGDRARRHDI